jgi:hypothetical protein
MLLSKAAAIESTMRPPMSQSIAARISSKSMTIEILYCPV